MPFSAKDRNILRILAMQVAEIAALPIQNETIELWKRHNALRPVRPMATIDQFPWGELTHCDLSLQTQCGDDFAVAIETQLRRTLWQWRNCPADMVVHPYFNLHKVIVNKAPITVGRTHTLKYDSVNEVVAQEYEDSLNTDEVVAALPMPMIWYNEAATMERYNLLNDAFGDILPIKLRGEVFNHNVWDQISTLKSVNAILYDIIDRPAFVHSVIKRMADIRIEYKRQVVEKGLLDAAPEIVHCSGAYCYDLPTHGYDPSQPQPRDTWASGMAQLFSTVSPAMHDEFEIEYALPFYADFGYVYYGCCEPLDKKIDIIRRIKNVRKISMSPWADVENGARQMGSNYIAVSKPNPAFLSGDTFSTENIAHEINHVITSCNKHGTPCEFNLKDISTCMYEPQRIRAWNDTVMGILRRCAY